MNDGVSLNISMILAVAFDGFLGAGPPPVYLCSFLMSENSFFAVEVKFFHLSRTSWAVRYATPTAFTASVISSHAVFFFALVMLLENLDRIRSRFSSTFSVNTVISELDQLVLRGRFCFPFYICETVATLDAILKTITFLTKRNGIMG